jgi:hypothetical protein
MTRGMFIDSFDSEQDAVHVCELKNETSGSIRLENFMTSYIPKHVNEYHVLRSY